MIRPSVANCFCASLLKLQNKMCRLDHDFQRCTLFINNYASIPGKNESLVIACHCDRRMRLFHLRCEGNPSPLGLPFWTAQSNKKRNGSRVACSQDTAALVKKPFTGNAGVCFQTIFLLQFECVDFGSLAALQWFFHASSHQEVVGVSARWNGE